MSPLSTADIRRAAEEMLARDADAGFGSQPTAAPLVSLFPVERQALDAKGGEHLISMTFTSSSEGRPHVVTIQPDDRVTCTCDAMLSIESRPRGCWAMSSFRKVKGIANP